MLTLCSRIIYPQIINVPPDQPTIQSGIDLVTVAEILGHSNTQTTKKYSHVSIDAMRDAMEK